MDIDNAFKSFFDCVSLFCYMLWTQDSDTDYRQQSQQQDTAVINEDDARKEI